MMTKQQFDNLILGDVLKHSSSPWAQWIVYAYDFRRGGVLVIRSNGMKTETKNVSKSDEWTLISKVLQRECYD